MIPGCLFQLDDTLVLCQISLGDPDNTCLFCSCFRCATLMWIEIGHTWQHNLSNVIIVTMNIVIPPVPTMVSVDVVVGLGAPKKVLDG